MQALWERRLEAARSSARAHEYAPEIAPFGWWFSSPRLNPAWALGQLKETLRIVGAVEPSRFVVERLSSLAASMPLDVVECLQLMIDGAKNEWEIQGWGTHMRAILQTVLTVTDDEPQRIATEVVNRLCARGFLGFQDLLP